MGEIRDLRQKNYNVATLSTYLTFRGGAGISVEDRPAVDQKKWERYITCSRLLLKL